VIAGIILAAGASSRMGSPKALLDYRGETFLNRLIRVLSGVCDPVIVVLGYHAGVIRESAAGRAQFVVNPAPERGQLSSLQTGLAAVPPESGGFLFVPVDSPAAEAETVKGVTGAFAKRNASTLLVVPQFHGKHGHPVCAAMSLKDELLALPATAQAREVIHLHRAETLYVDVEDPGILADVDHPEDYLRLARGHEARSAKRSGRVKPSGKVKISGNVK